MLSIRAFGRHVIRGPNFKLLCSVELKTITCFLMKLTATPAKLNTGRFKSVGSVHIMVKIERKHQEMNW